MVQGTKETLRTAPRTSEQRSRSVDLAEYSTLFSAVTVHFVGYRSDGSVVTTDFTTDGIIDGAGPLADFQTFYFNPAEWIGLQRVEVPGWGWSMDNLVVSVPEPGVWSLLALGVAIWAGVPFEKEVKVRPSFLQKGDKAAQKLAWSRASGAGAVSVLVDALCAFFAVRYKSHGFM